MSQRHCIAKVSLLTVLIVGGACKSPPALHQVKNPGRRADPLSASQAPAVPSVPVGQASLSASEAEKQLSDSIPHQAETTTESFTALNSSEPSLADAVSAIGSKSNDTLTNTSTELLAHAISIAPISSVELASSQVDVPNATAKSVPTARLVIAGVRVSQGKIKVAIYTDASTFPNPAGASQVFELASTNSTVETSLTNLKRFAVAVYQDINSDGELNRNRFGIPIEPFAFSNNVMGKRGPPSFEQAVIVQPTEAGVGGNGPFVVSIQLP